MLPQRCFWNLCWLLCRHLQVSLYNTVHHVICCTGMSCWINSWKGKIYCELKLNENCFFPEFFHFCFLTFSLISWDPAGSVHGVYMVFLCGFHLLYRLFLFYGVFSVEFVSLWQVDVWKNGRVTHEMTNIQDEMQLSVAGRVARLLKKFAVFYWIRWCIATFTRALLLHIFCQNISVLIILSCLFIIHSTIIHPFLLVCFLQDLLPNFVLNFLVLTICPAHLVLHLIILIISGEGYEWRSSSLCKFLQPPFNSTFLSPNILLSTLFSNTLSVCSSRNLRDQVSHRCRTTDKI
jgi:hypothetical protein